MKIVTHLLFAACLLVSLSACGQHKINPEARRLKDSAVRLTMGPLFKGDSTLLNKVNTPAKMMKVGPHGIITRRVYNNDSLYEKAIGLLNKATQIDSNYIGAYWSKFVYQCNLKRFKDALLSGKEMIRLRPNDTTIKYLVGKVYYKTGDTIQAKIYFQNYLTYCSSKLDTMSVNNGQYKFMELDKALLLIVLNQPNKGHEILEKLYREAGYFDKDYYDLYRHVTKTDLIEGKELTKTVGNYTISFSSGF